MKQTLILTTKDIILNEAKENERTFKGKISTVAILDNGKALQITFVHEDEKLQETISESSSMENLRDQAQRV